MNTKIKLSLMASISLLISAQAFAVVDFNRTVQSLGVQSGGSSGSVACISVVEGWSTSCAFGVVYVDLATNWGRAIYASVLAAKLSGKRLSRVDYNMDGSGICTANLVEMTE